MNFWTFVNRKSDFQMTVNAKVITATNHNEQTTR